MSYQAGHDGTSITSIKASNLPYMQDYNYNNAISSTASEHKLFTKDYMTFEGV